MTKIIITCMKFAPNPSPNVKKFNDVIKYFDGNRGKNKKFYTEELQKTLFYLLGKNNILSYIDNEERTEAAYNILESNKPEVWLRKCDKLVEIIPPHEIRKKILKIFSKSPKGLQNSIEQVEKLFNEENFNKFLQEGNFPEDTIVSLFLLFNSFKNITTFNDDTRRIPESKAEDASTVHMNTTWEREPFGLHVTEWKIIFIMRHDYENEFILLMVVCLQNFTIIAQKLLK